MASIQVDGDLLQNLEAEKHLYKSVIFLAAAFTLSDVVEKVSVKGKVSHHTTGSYRRSWLN